MLSRWESFLSIIYPESCLGCGESFVANETIICTLCLFELPKTYSHLGNGFSPKNRFLGKVQLEHAFAYYKFVKYSKVQQLMHAFKYQGKKEIGQFVGTIFGRELKEFNFFEEYDCVVPVPMHKSKIKKRGYNQAEIFGSAISAAIDKPMVTNVLLKKYNVRSQTLLAKFARYKSTEDIYIVSDAVDFKNVILVDDVITTGATVEHCANALKNAGVDKVSVLAMAMAQ